MATISSNTKTHCRARSISLPSTSNQQSVFNEFYRASLEATTSSSSSTIADKLRAANGMYESIKPFLTMESTRRSLAQECCKEQLNKFLDERLELLDICTSTKEVLSVCINSAKELQSFLRRKRGDKHGLTSSVEEYLDKKRKVKKIIFKPLTGLKKQCSSSVNEDNRITSNTDILKEMKLKTLTVFEALFTYILGSKSQFKPKWWSLVSRVMGNKEVESVQSREESRVKKMDVELQALICLKKTQTDILEVNTIQTELADFELHLLDLDEQVDCLCKHLIKTRVSILNILNF
ncbi:hypothetical protein L1987_48789 [Smallanthus sonchifolius]|uniref:Uncharacterized protein n=1 Tax=Smallanthus sonchifolius TaxID=185202 RepID=A0ACB9FSQ6_9ASTR|nr:hypothetical protein L1987_48789 [Smallanthus sonchifolius]